MRFDFIIILKIECAVDWVDYICPGYLTLAQSLLGETRSDNCYCIAGESQTSHTHRHTHTHRQTHTHNYLSSWWITSPLSNLWQPLSRDHCQQTSAVIGCKPCPTDLSYIPVYMSWIGMYLFFCGCMGVVWGEIEKTGCVCWKVIILQK